MWKKKTSFWLPVFLWARLSMFVHCSYIENSLIWYRWLLQRILVIKFYSRRWLLIRPPPVRITNPDHALIIRRLFCNDLLRSGSFSFCKLIIFGHLSTSRNLVHSLWSVIDGWLCICVWPGRKHSNKDSREIKKDKYFLVKSSLCRCFLRAQNEKLRPNWATEFRIRACGGLSNLKSN